MKIIAIILNVLLIGFTCLVLVTDGFPTDPVYVIFTLWSLVTLILSSVAIYYFGVNEGWLRLRKKNTAADEQNQDHSLSFTGTIMKIIGIIFNLVFIGFLCYAIVDQYPHPREQGFIAYIVLMSVTPILNLVVLFMSKVQN